MQSVCVLLFSNRITGDKVELFSRSHDHCRALFERCLGVAFEGYG